MRPNSVNVASISGECLCACLASVRAYLVERVCGRMCACLSSMCVMCFRRELIAACVAIRADDRCCWWVLCLCSTACRAGNWRNRCGQMLVRCERCFAHAPTTINCPYNVLDVLENNSSFVWPMRPRFRVHFSLVGVQTWTIVGDQRRACCLFLPACIGAEICAIACTLTA